MLLACALCLWGAPGCTSDGYPLDNTYHYQGKAPSSPPQASTYSYRYPDVAPVLGAKDLEEFVGKFHQRVVLLDFWASWSRETREEMMMLARLQEDMEDEGFQVVACSFDSEEKWGSTIVPMLHAARANFPCLVIPESARPEIRKWLSPNWNYDLPARFVINRQGIVSASALAGTSIGVVEQQARQAVNGSGRYVTKLTGTAAAVRVKIIDCRQGTAVSLPEVVSDPASPAQLAGQIAGLVESRIERAKNPRIALLSFGDAKDRSHTGPMGIETAGQLESALKQKGYTDLISPDETKKLLQDSGLSAMSVDYEPSFVAGKITADYLLIGWLRDNTAPPRSVAKAPPPKAKTPEHMALLQDSPEPRETDEP